MADWIAERLGWEALKKIWSVYLRQLIYREGKIRPKRLIVAIFIVALGLFLYYLPERIPWLAEGFRIYNPEDPGLGGVLRTVYFLDNSEEYLRVFQYMMAFAYLAVLAILTVVTIRNRHRELDSTIKEQKEVVEFAKAVKLSHGSRCAKKQERGKIIPVVAEGIAEASKIRIMAVNAYHDLVDSSSEIRKALEEKEKSLNLRVLLLDPYSEYTRLRAEEILPGEDAESALMRYIFDCYTVQKELDHIRDQRGGTVEYRYYCSKPFFRMYLLDKDLFIQAYESKKHGYASPMYHYEAGENSLFQLGEEMFNYHWKRGFLFEPKLLEKKGNAFTVFLAKQYDLLPSEENISDIAGLRIKIIEHATSKREKAEEFSRKGFLPNVD